jgi:hypothetical protein
MLFTMSTIKDNSATSEVTLRIFIDFPPNFSNAYNSKYSNYTLNDMQHNYQIIIF